MPSLTINRDQMQALVDSGQDQFYIAKDSGAYIGACGVDPIYFRGCDPNKDEDWYETARGKFGGDDFGEHAPMQLLKDVLGDDSVLSLKVNVNSSTITFHTTHRRTGTDLGSPG